MLNMTKQIKQFFKKQKETLFQFAFILLAGFLMFASIATLSSKSVAIKNPIDNDMDTIHYVEVIKSTAYMEYTQAKEELIMEVDKYIKGVAPKSKLSGQAVVDACIDYGRDVVFVLAQGHQESHFGTAGVARKTNSVFNVGSYDGSSSSEMIKKGYGFPHPDESVIPYLELISTKYMVNGKTEQDMLRNYATPRGSRYATSKTYESDLREKYNDITRNTSIQSKYKQVLCLYETSLIYNEE